MIKEKKKMARIMKLYTVIMLLVLLTSANSYATSSAYESEQRSLKAVRNDNYNDMLDGGITGSKYEEQFDELVNSIYELRKEGRSFEEIDSIIEPKIVPSNTSVLKKVVLRAKGLDPSDMFYDYAHLNKLEKNLFKNNKTKALLCLANGKLALKYSEDLSKKEVLHNGNGDAFRHTLWNYGMAIDVGQSFAKKWADAHENGASGQPDLEKEMDLYNNKVGRGLAKTYPNTVSHSTFKKNAKAKVRAGSCRIISNKKLVKSSKKGER